MQSLPKATLDSKPRARDTDLVVQPLDGELVIYDPTREVAHHLNATAALIWQHCDGHHTVAQIAQRVAVATHAPLDERAVWYALRQFERDHLLDEGLPVTASHPSMTRREFLKRTALAAALVPAVKTLKLPDPQQAATCLGFGESCGESLPPCCSPLFCDEGQCLGEE